MQHTVISSPNVRKSQLCVCPDGTNTIKQSKCFVAKHRVMARCPLTGPIEYYTASSIREIMSVVLKSRGWTTLTTEMLKKKRKQEKKAQRV